MNYNLAKVGGSHIDLSWFSCRSFILVELKFGDVGYWLRRKTREPGENPESKVRINNTVQNSTYI